MRNRIEGVYERVIACAAEEFLEKGYMDASLRTIAEKAETSTNSIYVRFKDKEGLFAAIVEPVSEEFLSRCLDVQETFHSFDSETQRREAGTYSGNAMLDMVDYMYDHLNEFRLLLDASYGTKFHNFVDRLISIEEEYTWKWMEVTGARMELEDEMTKEFYHIMTTSYYEGVFEVVRHKMSRENARKYVAMMGKYHHAGFMAIIGSDRGIFSSNSVK